MSRFLLLPVFFATSFFASCYADTLVPFIIIPCLTGSRLDAKLVHKQTRYPFCPRDTDWFPMFAPTEAEMVPPHVYCLGENLELTYNASTGQYHNFPGVQTRVPDYGNTTAVEFLVAPDKSPLYHDLIQMLVMLGYERGVNLRAAPYDWRLGADGHATSYAQLQALIEETYVMNNNTRVVLHSFSLGAPYVHGFLTQFVTQAWKDKYVARLISISGAFPGSTVGMMATLFVRAAGLPWFVPEKLYSGLVEGLAAPYWMLPFADMYGDQVFLTTPKRNYTAKDWVQLYKDANKMIATDMVEAMVPYRTSVTPPGVDVVCLYGYNVSTPLRVVTNSSTFSTMDVVMADGDNTVLRAGLELCDVWATQQTQPSQSIPVANLQHGDGLYHPLAVRLVLESLGL